MIDEIKHHFSTCYPREGCGVIVLDNGQARWIPCSNVACQNDSFVLCPSEYAKILIKYKVLAVVHNHIEYTCLPSANDIKYCDELDVPFFIFSYPSMELYKLFPKDYDESLLGRPYVWGIYDCLSLVIEYYARFKQITLRSRPYYIDNWWRATNVNYMDPEHIRTWGFIKTNNPQKDDIAVLQMGATIPNHIGIVLENDQFLHHAYNRLSTIENLYPLWGKYAMAYYTYEK